MLSEQVLKIMQQYSVPFVREEELTLSLYCHLSLPALFVMVKVQFKLENPITPARLVRAPGSISGVTFTAGPARAKAWFTPAQDLQVQKRKKNDRNTSTGIKDNFII